MFVNYRSQQQAFRFLRKILADDRGIGLLHGPESSGKTVLVQQFVQELPSDQTVAFVNGARLKPNQLLSRTLGHFGYDVTLTSDGDLLNLLDMFAVQQTRTVQAPLLILENIHEMYPSALSVLCKLAELTTNGRFALRLVLTSHCDFQRIIDSPSMTAIARRIVGDFEMEPLTSQESLNYLYEKLRASGAKQPDDVFSVDTCDKIYSASSGWPGKLDDVAMSILEMSSFEMSTTEEAHDLPLLTETFDYPDLQTDDETPTLIITIGGKISQDVELSGSRTLIGRAELCDIIVEDQFVSKQHALMIRERGAVILVDLKSANGTFVNSRRVQSAVLRNNDIISIGDHRMKLILANCQVPAEPESRFLADTATMKSVADARRERSNKISSIDEHLANRTPLAPRRK